MEFNCFQNHKNRSRCKMTSAVSNEEEFEASLCQGALYKRKDFLGKEEDAKLTQTGLTIFEKSVDIDQLILSCSNKLSKNPSDSKVYPSCCFCKKTAARRSYKRLFATNIKQSKEFQHSLQPWSKLRENRRPERSNKRLYYSLGY